MCTLAYQHVATNWFMTRVHCHHQNLINMRYNEKEKQQEIINIMKCVDNSMLNLVEFKSCFS